MSTYKNEENESCRQMISFINAYVYGILNLLSINLNLEMKNNKKLLCVSSFWVSSFIYWMADCDIEHCWKTVYILYLIIADSLSHWGFYVKWLICLLIYVFVYFKFICNKRDRS